MAERNKRLQKILNIMQHRPRRVRCILYTYSISIYSYCLVYNKRGRAYTPPTLSSVTSAHTPISLEIFVSFSGTTSFALPQGVPILSLHILILLVPSAVVEHVDMSIQKKVHQHSITATNCACVHRHFHNINFVFVFFWGWWGV